MKKHRVCLGALCENSMLTCWHIVNIYEYNHPCFTKYPQICAAVIPQANIIDIMFIYEYIYNVFGRGLVDRLTRMAYG